MIIIDTIADRQYEDSKAFIENIEKRVTKMYKKHKRLLLFLCYIGIVISIILGWQMEYKIAIWIGIIVSLLSISFYIFTTLDYGSFYDEYSDFLIILHASNILFSDIIDRYIKNTCFYKMPCDKEAIRHYRICYCKSIANNLSDWGKNASPSERIKIAEGEEIKYAIFPKLRINEHEYTRKYSVEIDTISRNEEQINDYKLKIAENNISLALPQVVRD